MTTRVRADDFVARAALDDEDLTRSDPPLVVVELSGSVPDAVEVGALPAVLVGLGDATGSLANSLDLVTDDERVVASIERSVTATPLAAVALALLLRGRDGRSAAEALVAESMTYSLLQAGPEFVGWRTARRGAPVPADPEPPVLVSIDGATLHVTLNRPHRHNAYSVTMRDGLVDALRLAAADPGPARGARRRRAVVLERGRPRRVRRVRRPGDGARRAPHPQRGATADRPQRPRRGARARGLHRCRRRAAGLRRRVVAHPDTTFTLPELAFGLVPGAGGTASLPPRIGRQRTAQLALTAEPIDAPTALAWGLVDRLSG